MPPRKKKQSPRPEDAPPATSESAHTREPVGISTQPVSSEAPGAPAATEAVGTPAGPAEGGPDAARQRVWQPDPFVLMAVSLGPERDSPKVRLYRSNKLNQMAIRFDEKPEQA